MIRFADASLRGVDHDQQLDEMLCDRPRGGLDDEHVRAAHRVVVAAVRLAVGERLQLARAEVDAEVVGDLLRELRMRAARRRRQALPRREPIARPACGSAAWAPRAAQAGQRLLNRSAFHRALS